MPQVFTATGRELVQEPLLDRNVLSHVSVVLPAVICVHAAAQGWTWAATALRMHRPRRLIRFGLGNVFNIGRAGHAILTCIPSGPKHPMLSHQELCHNTRVSMLPSNLT